MTGRPVYDEAAIQCGIELLSREIGKVLSARSQVALEVVLSGLDRLRVVYADPASTDIYRTGVTLSVLAGYAREMEALGEQR